MFNMRDKDPRFKIPEDDKSKIRNLYEKLCSPGFCIDSEHFVGKIGWNMFIDWVFEKCRLDGRSPPTDGHKGDTFRDYIIDETHYELERESKRSARFSWDEKTEKFIGLSAEEYESTRDRALEAFVKSTINTFKGQDGTKIPRMLGYDSINFDSLRVSLESYFQPAVLSLVA